MKVDAIRNLNIGKNYNFGSNEKSHEGVRTEGRADSTMLTKVPVIVMLAMNPATLNSALPMMPETDNPNQIVMLAPETNAAEKSSYVISPEMQQSNTPPFGWASLNFYDIKKVVHGKMPLAEFDMLFATTKNAGYDYQHDVTHVFLIQKGGKVAKSMYTEPPKIEQLIYHNTGDGKEFYTIRVYEKLLDNDGNKTKGMRSEMRIDNKSAQQLQKLLEDNSSWNNATLIPFTETNNRSTMKTIFYE